MRIFLPALERRRKLAKYLFEGPVNLGCTGP